MTHIALWVGVIGNGVMAGIYFTFSTFVMQSLGAIPRAEGIAAMQSINGKIVHSAFLPLFFATTALSAGMAIWGVVRWGESGSTAMFAGGLLYFVGMFICTVVFNVPLNDQLDAVDPQSSEAVRIWSDYLRVWTRWNHVRTISCAASAGLLLAALVR